MLTFSFKDWDRKQQLKHVALTDGLPECIVQDCRLSHCLLADKHLKDVSFVGGSIVHSRFENCKLTYASFERTDLTDTSFVGCDLRNASFKQCKTWYTKFENCELNYESVVASAPEEGNLRLAFFRRLRTNATEIGEKYWADRLLVMELRTREQLLLSILLGRTEYYRQKYSGFDRFKAGIDLAAQFLNRFWWGTDCAFRILHCRVPSYLRCSRRSAGYRRRAM